MNIPKSIFHSIIVMGLAGCVSAPGVSKLDNPESNRVAILTDYHLADGFITIQAVGYGCTYFNSFKLAVVDPTENSIEVIRTRPDKCRMKPRNVSLQYSYKHLGLDLNRHISVKNPLVETITDYTASYENRH